MEPSKFEKHIAKKLKEREITPSPAAWEAIESRLKHAPSKPSRNGKYWVYGIAASLLLLLGLYQWTGPGADTPNVNLPGAPIPVAVSPPTEAGDPTPVRTDATPLPAATDPNEAEKGLKAVEGLAQAPHSSGGAQRGGASEPANGNPDGTHLAVASQEEGMETQTKRTGGEIRDGLSSDTPLDAQIALQLDSVLMRVGELESEGVQVTDADIEVLLQEARQSIGESRGLTPSGPVDAMALLDAAERELDQSFRDQLMEKLRNGFDQVRLAMAHKND